VSKSCEILLQAQTQEHEHPTQQQRAADVAKASPGCHTQAAAQRPTLGARQERYGHPMVGQNGVQQRDRESREQKQQERRGHG